MFGLSSFSIIGLACVLAFGSGATVGYKATRSHYEHVAEKAAEAQREAVDRANVNAEAAAELYEAARNKQTVRTVTVTKEVEREIQTDTNCAAVAIPDGLRRALESAADPDKPLADGRVPAVSSPGTEDVGRLGPGLRFGPRVGQRLPSASEGSGSGG